MKLKTLEDLPMNHDDEDIKAEAVNWVKELRGNNEIQEINDWNVRNWIIHFFNLTEADLEDKK